MLALVSSGIKRLVLRASRAGETTQRGMAMEDSTTLQADHVARLTVGVWIEVAAAAWTRF